MAKMKFEAKLGKKVQAQISGFKGIITARTEYLHNCVRVEVTPEGLDKEDKPREGKWFDEGELGFQVESTGGPERSVAPSRDP